MAEQRSPVRLVNCRLSIFVCAIRMLAAAPDLTIEIKDYATFPITGAVDGKSNAASLLARINFLREEPGPKKRFFVNDVNGQLYILDKDTKKLTTYLNFNGLEGQS